VGERLVNLAGFIWHSLFRKSWRLEMQGVIKAYDPVSGDGVVMCDSNLADYELAPGALDGSIFRMLRQGQRVLFVVDGGGRATQLRLGSERDMETPTQ